MAHSITFEDRATVVFVWVDDGYPCHGVRCLPGQVGQSRSSVTVKS